MVLIILSAGFSTRLEPRTLKIPKQLLPVGEKVFLDLFLESIATLKNKFSRKIFVTNEKFYPLFSKRAKQNDWGFKIISDGVMSKDKRLGAVGDLLFAIGKEEISDDVFVVCPDYILENFDFAEFLKKFSADRCSYTIAKKENNQNILKSGSCLTLDKGGFISRFQEKPSKPFSKLYGVPYYAIKKSDIKFIKQIPAKEKDNAGEIVAELVQMSKIKAVQYLGSIIHLTNENDYQKITKGY
jgi:glucose-1-phosphate thymidylyltransferase